MGLLGQIHTLGERQRFYRMAETTAGTFVKPTSAGSMRVISSEFKADYPNADRTNSYMSSRDVITTDRIVQQGDISWSVESYLTSSGDISGTPDSPTCGPFIVAAMGTAEAKTTDKKCVYALSSVQYLSGFTLSLTRNFQDLWMESIAGAAVDEMNINVSGGKEARIKFSGPAIGPYAYTGSDCTLSTDEATGQTVLSVTEAVAHNIMVGSVINLTDADGTDSNLQVTAVSRATGACTITVTPALGTDQASSSCVITPYVPTFAEDAIDSVTTCALSGSISLMGTTLTGISAFDITLKNNIQKIQASFNPSNMADGVMGIREITGKIGSHMREDLITVFAKRNLRKEGFTTVTGALTVVIGTSATANCWTISCPYVELDFLGAVGVPENGIIPCEFSFKALGSSGNDALTITMGDAT